MLFGLIGKSLSHSFSKNYFTELFERQNLPHSYSLFELEKVEYVIDLLANNQQLKGLNVTIPFKSSIIPFLDELDETAQAIGAVNTIQITKGKSKGFNTDVYGFETSLLHFYPADAPKAALVLGTGGSAKAVAFVLNKLDFIYQNVSRTADEENLTFVDLSPELVAQYPLFINCTPVGMYPNLKDALPLPFPLFTKNHYFFDLIYNPAQTATAKLLGQQGVHLQNGLEMLHLQADKSWEIWNFLP